MKRSKIIKKVFSATLCALMAVNIVYPSLAVESGISLDKVAAEYIKCSVYENETVYSNLQEFYKKAKEDMEFLTDLELATYVMEYTGQSCEKLSEETILEALEFLEIACTSQVFKVSEDGTVQELTASEINSLKSDSGILPAAVWESEDGYLEIETTASKGSAGTAGTPFVLGARAVWLKTPANKLKDTFGIAYGGSFDDSYPVTATFEESGECSWCGKTFYYEGTEKYGPDSSNSEPHFIQTSNLIELDFGQSHVVSAISDLKDITCLHTEDSTFSDWVLDESVVSSIRFRVLASDTTEAKAAYAHTKLAGVVTIGATVSGTSVTPTFSGVLNIIAAKYTAAPVTLRCG